jgi:hypothetical protein
MQENTQQNKKAPDTVTITKPQYDSGKTLKSKEDYLGKLLEGVEVLQTIKHMNDVENEFIDEFIESLFEEMKPEEQKQKEQKEKEEQDKKEKEQEEQKQEGNDDSKKEEEQGEASDKKPSTEQGSQNTQQQSQSSSKENTTDKSSDSQKTQKEEQKSATSHSPSNSQIEEAMKRIEALKEAMKANKIQAQKAGSGAGSGEKLDKLEQVEQTSVGKGGTGIDDGGQKPDKNEGQLPTLVDGYEGGESQGRNKSVNKTQTGRLYAKPKRG